MGPQDLGLARPRLSLRRDFGQAAAHVSDGTFVDQSLAVDLVSTGGARTGIESQSFGPGADCDLEFSRQFAAFLALAAQVLGCMYAKPPDHLPQDSLVLFNSLSSTMFGLLTLDLLDRSCLGRGLCKPMEKDYRAPVTGTA